MPYPLGFCPCGLDGGIESGIDDPDAGWKGRVLYVNYGIHLGWHSEGGKGTIGKVLEFQSRPDPLAY